MGSPRMDRRPAVRDPVQSPKADGTLAAAEETPEELIRRLAGRLPTEERNALVYRELDGLTFEEVGVRLGVSTNRARRLGGDARKGLKRVLLAQPGDGAMTH